jgi:hypothetical protein
MAVDPLHFTRFCIRLLVIAAFNRLLIGILLLMACESLVAAQNATANRNVRLRRDPSVGSPIVAQLPRATRLVLVDSAVQSGFYHARTEDEQVGWVWSKYVDVSTAGQVAGTVTHSHPAAPAASDAQCDAALWNHVYHPARLMVVESCIAVTGMIVDATAGRQTEGVRHEKDGDTHGWLKLDPEFANLLNAGNISSEGGNLVFEIVCRFPVTQPDAQSACQNYADRVALPPVGSHVRIVGTYVQDTFHAQWMEIHPVTSIAVIQ